MGGPEQGVSILEEVPTPQTQTTALFYERMSPLAIVAHPSVGPPVVLQCSIYMGLFIRPAVIECLSRRRANSGKSSLTHRPFIFRPPAGMAFFLARAASSYENRIPFRKSTIGVVRRVFSLFPLTDQIGLWGRRPS